MQLRLRPPDWLGADQNLNTIYLIRNWREKRYKQSTINHWGEGDKDGDKYTDDGKDGDEHNKFNLDWGQCQWQVNKRREMWS